MPTSIPVLMADVALDGPKLKERLDQVKRTIQILLTLPAGAGDKYARWLDFCNPR